MLHTVGKGITSEQSNNKTGGFQGVGEKQQVFTVLVRWVFLVDWETNSSGPSG